MPGSDKSRWWVAAEVLVAATAVTLPWALGGSPTWSTGLLLALGGGALLLWCVGAARHHRRITWHPALWLPVGVLGLGVLQLVPLPEGLLGLLSRPGAELRDFALVPLGLTRARPLSADPPSTARAIARLVGLAAVFLVSLQLSRRRAVGRRLAAVVALTGASVAVCGFGHLLAGEEDLFGIHHFVLVMLVTPFGNTNHLAAFLTLAGTAALALALDSRSRDQVVGWVATALVCGVGAFLSYSRGGIAAFLVTWTLVGAAVLARRGGGLKAVLPWVAIGATVLFAALLSFEQLVERAESLSTLQQLQSSKVELWPMFARGALASWPLGIGLGAFEVGFARFQTVQFDVTFTHPENLVLQWAAEAGLPLTLALGAALAYLARRAWLAARDTSFERYLYIGLAGLVLHDLVDFSLELNAVSTCAAVVAGIVLAADVRAPASPFRGRGFLAAAAAVALGAVALALGFPAHPEAEAELGAAIHQGQLPTEVRERALAAIDRHPGDWVLYADMANDVARRGNPLEALAWTNRVLFLRQADARVHVAAAQALLRLGHPLQALGELHTAWELNDTRTLGLGLSLAGKAGVWERVLVDRKGFLTDAWALLRRQGRDEQALALLDAALTFPPSDQVRREAAALRVQHVAELGDPATALALIEGLDEETRAAPQLQLARVHLLYRLHQDAQAVAELEKVFARHPTDSAIGYELASALAGQGRPLSGLEVLQRLKPFVSDPAQRAGLFQREAQLWVGLERWGRALDALATASRLQPLRPDLHYRKAEVFERMGSLPSALDEVRRGRTLDSPEGAKRQDAWVDRLESAQAPR